ncbi:MAG TPA: Rpn family recombination-promoting nuclease/putative transposase [Thermoanaerobaculia bacterium]|nr:Rpn family recombination-promoting nuclease/putative transposase [Thermoanaerobaculia bacterium]
MPERHDSGYRLLFSHSQMVEDLLRGLVWPGGMPEDLDPVWLERGSEVRVSAWLDRREQDMVWRVGRRRGEPDFYLLLEFQSEVDPQMEVRMAVYRGLLHQDLVRSREISRWDGSPLFVPVVLYNGAERWLWGAEIPGSGNSYLLIDVLRDPLPGDPDNLVSLLFELERSRSPEALGRPIRRLATLLAGADGADLRRAFCVFLRESLLPGRFPEARIPELLELEEVRPMLRQTVLEWTREWERQGRRDLLVRQLERRFGPLGGRDRERVDGADSERLLDWAERILTARSLDEVFGT